MSKRDWYVDHFGGDDNTRVVRNRADKDQIVAGPGDYRHYESCTIVEGIDESDAALIAASPRLLKLAEALVQSWEATADGCTAVRHNDGEVINVRELIARAKGTP
jgi:hypothetical protein